MGFKTYAPKQDEIDEQWWLVDAEGQTLGRLATRLATILRGKHRPTFSTHVDVGDHVVVVNAEKIEVTGNKMADKMYYRHSGYPGGLTERTLAEMLEKHPERVIRSAVRGMLPRNRMRQRLMRKLRVYAGPDHPHEAQGPVPLDRPQAEEEK
jgi:large subunit ribosomal protein L13